MIYEMRTYTLRPRALPEFLKRFGEAYEKRKRFSELYAFWYSELGPLNQVVHVWPYQDITERTRIRAEAVKDGSWPPKTAEFITQMQTDIMLPMAGVPTLPPGKLGPFFEMRTYTFAAGDLPKIEATWEKAVPARQKFSPLAALWHSEIGALNKFVHIWPYKDLNARMDTRKRAVDSGSWPPSGPYTLLTQESKILLAAPFSPMQ